VVIVFEVDVWLTCRYTLLIGTPPFETTDVKAVYERIRQNAYAFPTDVQISDAAQNLIRKLLNSKPECRPKLEEIRKDEWITSSSVTQPSKSATVNTLSVRPPLSSISNLPQANPIASSNPRCDNDVGKVVPQNNGLFKKPLPTVPPLSNQLALAPTTYNNQQVEQIAVISSSPDDILEKQFPKIRENLMFQLNKLISNPCVDNGTVSLCVSRWIDYSAKYGLAYLLSDGTVGMYFNDFTKMVLAPNQMYIDYIGTHNRQRMTKSTLADSLKKKLVLLFTIYNQLQDKGIKENITELCISDVMKDADLEDVRNHPPLPYVKKWLRTKHAMFFRFSGAAAVLQVNFVDHRKVVISSNGENLLFLDKHQNIKILPLASVDTKHHSEIASRLSYIEQIISQII